MSDPISRSDQQWEEIFRKKGYKADFETTARLTMDLVNKARKRKYTTDGKQYTWEFLAEESKRLAKQGTIPKSFLSRTLRRAKNEGRNVEFSTAYALSEMLDLDLKKFVVKTFESGEEEGGTDVFGGVVPHINTCIALSVVPILVTLSTYIAIGLQVDFDVSGRLMPATYTTATSIAGYYMRTQTQCSLPRNLKILFGLMIGIITGMLCFYALSLFGSVQNFDAYWVVQASILLFLAAGVCALFLGQEFAANLIDNGSFDVMKDTPWRWALAATLLTVGVILSSNYPAMARAL